MDNHDLVREQYGAESLLERVSQAIAQAELTASKLVWTDLVPLDQFHVRGLAATRELAEALHINAGDTLLDIGCGLGGPARFLTANYRCQVTGIDLNQSFVEVATMLSDRCGLSEQTLFQRADALNLPFADATFRLAWTQHVAMNIRDRAKLCSEIARVLQPGGGLAIYDVIAGNGQPLIFPVPWARQPAMSHLLTADAMREVLEESGLRETTWADKTDAANTWFAEVRSNLAQSPPLSLSVVMGPEFLTMAENLGRNLEEGRVRIVQAIFTRF